MKIIHATPSTIEDIKKALRTQNLDSASLRIYPMAG